MAVVKPSLTNSVLRPVQAMRTHHGVNHVGNLFQIVIAERGAGSLGLLGSITAGIAVDRLAALDPPANFGRQGFIGVGGAGEQRVAQRLAIFHGNFVGIQQRAAAGRGHVREIAVPVLAGVLQADGVAVLDHIGDHQNFGMAGLEIHFGGMNLKLAQAAAEIDVLLIGQMLIAEYDDAAVVEQVFDPAKGGVVDGLREIEP